MKRISVLLTLAVLISCTRLHVPPSPSAAYFVQDLNTEEYSRIEENKFFEAIKYPLSTFGADVDVASYANCRRFLHDGKFPPRDAVRIEEFINYFNYDYKAPLGERPISINLEYGKCPWNDSNNLLHIGIKAQEVQKDEYLPNNLIFLIDVSGSMMPANKLPLLKNAFGLLVNQLNEEDNIAIVVYASQEGLVLPPTSGKDKAKILEAINNLSAGGSTAGGAGIRMAYRIAEENYLKDGNNRIILATDGDFNVGISSTSELTRYIEEKRDNGIFLTILGFGEGNIKDSRLEQLADHGNGHYAYIDNSIEARKVLVHEIGGTLYTIAKDVKIQVEFNPARIKEYRLIGYENRLMDAEDFEDDTKDSGDMGSGHTVTALYEIVPIDSSLQPYSISNNLRYTETRIKQSSLETDEILTVKFRYKNPNDEKSEVLSEVVKVNSKGLDETSDNFNFSAAVAEFGMLLRDSKYKADSSFENAISLAEKSVGDDEFGYRSEFVFLVKTAKSLKR